jgi:hypothetical protein
MTTGWTQHARRLKSVAGNGAITMSFLSWIGMASSSSHGQNTTKLFAAPCGRGPHKIKMSPLRPGETRLDFRRPAPRDPQIHLRRQARDDRSAPRVKKVATQGKLFDPPTDIAWLPEGTFFVSDGYGGKRVAKFD